METKQEEKQIAGGGVVETSKADEVNELVASGEYYIDRELSKIRKKYILVRKK